MKIIVEKITTDALLSEAVRFIFNRENRSTLARGYRSEHSPVRTQLFAVFSADTPYSVCMQMRTHDKNGALFLIEPGRPDTGTDRAKSQSGDYRSRLRNMFILCNAQHIIDWSHKRLCMKAEAPTRTWFEALRLEVAKCDPELSIFLEPMCAYRNGICAEFQSCGNPQKHPSCRIDLYLRPPSNADKLRRSSIDQLADFFAENVSAGCPAGYSVMECTSHMQCKTCWREWLSRTANPKGESK